MMEATAPQSSPVLEVSNLVVRHGAAEVIRDASIEVGLGEAVAVVGRNGAGKTTLLRTIFGFLRPTSGQIRFMGDSAIGRRPHEMAALGLAMVPDDRGIFRELTVADNLRLGALHAPGEADRRREQVLEQFPALRDRLGAVAGTLSGGQQQMLGLARALMAGPKLLLLDEPSLGLAPRVLDELFEALRALAGAGTTVLLVEQNARRALEIVDRGYLMDLGRVVAEGPAASLLDDERVRQTYLGASHRS